MKIKFGTSGWRALIADTFTFDNVRVVVQAIADEVKYSKDKKKSVLLGGDRRFLTEEFIMVAAEVLAANGIETAVCPVGVPTPVVSSWILKHKLSGGINFTASHNPYNYQGIKFTPSWGGPALPETTSRIESSCEKIFNGHIPVKSLAYEKAVREKLIRTVDPRPLYLKEIKKIVNISALKKARLRIGVDPLFGAGMGYLDKALESAGCRISVIHNRRDVLFGGMAPDPTPHNLRELSQLVKRNKLDMGVSTDGDADRFGIIDSDGSFITPNQVLPLLLYHLIKTRKWKGVVVRSVMTSHFVDAVARHYNITVRETPVGFKYIGQIMIEDDFIIGGEESGGLSINGHVPEKDGILACLLMAELRAVEKKPFKKILENLQRTVGYFYSDRINMPLDEKTMGRFHDRMSSNQPVKINGFSTVRILDYDGWKYIFRENAWMGIRLSGTEPVVRLYVEADNKKDLAKLYVSGKKLIEG